MKVIFFMLFLPFKVFAIAEYNLIIKDHHFIPAELIVVSGEKFHLFIDNQDEEAEEFESFDLRREKIIPPKSKVKINISPLEPGEYNFFGEFHINIAKGKIIAK